MKTKKINGVDCAVIKREVEDYIPVDDISKKIAEYEAMIIATQNTLDDYKNKKKELEDL